MDGPSTNRDLLAWFDENERHECPSCRERAAVSVAEALAIFCLACGTISIDGAAIEIAAEPVAG